MFDLAFQPSSDNAKYARQISSSASIAVFVAQHADPAHRVKAVLA